MNGKEKALLAAKAKVLKALAHPARLWMVEQLEGGERCVCELVDGLGLDFSTVSKHLLVLKNAGVVADDKRGKQVFYSLSTELEEKHVLLVKTQSGNTGRWGMARLWRSWMEATAKFMAANGCTMPLMISPKGQPYG